MSKYRLHADHTGTVHAKILRDTLTYCLRIAHQTGLHLESNPTSPGALQSQARNRSRAAKILAQFTNGIDWEQEGADTFTADIDRALAKLRDGHPLPAVVCALVPHLH